MRSFKRELILVWVPVLVAVLSFGISLTAGAIAIQSSAHIAAETKARVQQNTNQEALNAATQKTLLCSFVEPLSQLAIITAPATSATGQALVDNYNATIKGAGITAKTLNCPIQSAVTSATPSP